MVPNRRFWGDGHKCGWFCSHDDNGKRRRKKDEEDFERSLQLRDYALERRKWIAADEPKPITLEEIKNIREWIRGGCYAGHIHGGFAINHLGAMDASLRIERREKEEAIMGKMGYVLDECEKLLRGKEKRAQ